MMRPRVTWKSVLLAYPVLLLAGLTSAELRHMAGMIWIFFSAGAFGAIFFGLDLDVPVCPKCRKKMADMGGFGFDVGNAYLCKHCQIWG